MKKINCFRHGEICFLETKELPSGLKKEKTKTIMEGSTGNGHKISSGNLYFKKVDQYIFGYLEAKNTTLLHREHGDKKTKDGYMSAIIPDGIYELRRAIEKTPDGLRVVYD
jgi:hypothetical protein